MPARDASDSGFTIRPYTAADRPKVDRLLKEGVLPGRVNYEMLHADRLKRLEGSDREKFLVAEADGKIIGTLALVEAEADVGHLHWMRVDPAWQKDLSVARALARAAAEHAREVGLLKLAVHAPESAEQRIAAFYHQLGFELSRTRDPEGVHVLEFYLNLYEQPPDRDASS